MSPLARASGPARAEAQRARLSAFHRGACCSERTPQLNSSDALPVTVLGRNGRYPLPAVVQCSDVSRTGHSAGRASDPESPGSEVTSPARGYRSRSVIRPSPVTSLYRARWGPCFTNGDYCQQKSDDGSSAGSCAGIPDQHVKLMAAAKPAIRATLQML